MARVWSLVCALLLGGTAAALHGCLTTTGTQTPGDAGSGLATCITNEDCKAIDEFDECVAGLCQRPCSTDDVCDPNEFCTAQGYCQVGCRDSTGCTDDKLCLDGVCRGRDEVGSCATKADCTNPPNTNICRDGVCVPPPAQCNRPDDCPGPQQCNGFTHTCFDPTPECSVDADCAGKSQCTNGCTCNPERKCTPTPTCTLATEATDCAAGTYCDTTQNPGRCKTSPPCQKQSDCDAFDLACDVAAVTCKRSPSCPATPSPCVAPFSYCNATAGYCQAPTCTNGGITCGANETCRADGTCGPSGATTCTSHNDCPATQFCHASSLTCRPGCRSNANCTAPQICNSEGSCVNDNTGGGGGDGTPCEDDSVCRSGYSCSGIGVCRENCQSGQCPPCPQTGYGCVFVWCAPSAEPPQPAGDGGYICN
ncbi:MAG: hypothetical protein AB2A00_07895 [Myxococcota bacterium]